ncbi:MAG: hypothetical protein H0V93_02090 [Euzebyales bacterium]|nr:hypothetical protein [Euzebyales bacterium]
MDVLIVGDQFIPARCYLDAFGTHDDGELIAVRAVDWAGDKAEQHELQQRMERAGPNVLDPPFEFLDAMRDAEALCLHFAPVGRALLDAAPRLRLIAVARSGLENVDVTAATARGIGVAPAHGRNAGAVAELQIGLILAEARNIARADASIKEGGWRKEFPGLRLELTGRVVGMVGFGHVGRAFAQRVAGFGVRLLAHDPLCSDELLARYDAERASSLEEVFAAGDFVVVQARLTEQTERFITARHLALMPPHAYFINVSRSRLVDNDALLDVLERHAIAGAGLDVFDEEPLPADSPWRKLDNVTLTTHFGGDTEDTNRRSAGLVADAVMAFARQGRVPAAANAVELGWA